MSNPFGMISNVPFCELLKAFPAVGRPGQVSSMNWHKVFSARDQKRGFGITVLHLVRENLGLGIHREVDPRIEEFAAAGMVTYGKCHPILGPIYRAGDCRLNKEHEKGKLKITYICIIKEAKVYELLKSRYDFYQRFTRKVNKK